MTPEEIEGLVGTIAFALKTSSLRPRHKDASRNDLQTTLVAKDIVEHLLRCRYEITQRPPAENRFLGGGEPNDNGR